MVSPLCNLWFQSILPKLSWTMNTNYSRVIAQEIHISVFFPVAVTQAAPCERPEFKRQLWTLIWHQMDQIYCPPILAVQSWNTLLPCMQNCCSVWLYNSSHLPCRMAPLLHGLVIRGYVPGYCWPTDSHREIQAQHPPWQSHGKPGRSITFTESHIIPQRTALNQASSALMASNCWQSW